MKMSFSCTRGAHFQGFRPPRSIPNSMKKRSKNETLVCTVFGRFGKPFCDHFGIKIASKTRSKNHADFGSILDGFWLPIWFHFGQILASNRSKIKIDFCRKKGWTTDWYFGSPEYQKFLREGPKDHRT